MHGAAACFVAFEFASNTLAARARECPQQKLPLATSRGGGGGGGGEKTQMEQ